MSKPVLQVTVSTAREELWVGNAHSISSENSDGPFDVLPMHANFITLVSNTPITVIGENGHGREFMFKQAIVYVANNVAKVYGYDL